MGDHGVRVDVDVNGEDRFVKSFVLEVQGPSWEPVSCFKPSENVLSSFSGRGVWKCAQFWEGWDLGFAFSFEV